jgi:hypothetical protein
VRYAIQAPLRNIGTAGYSYAFQLARLIEGGVELKERVRHRKDRRRRGSVSGDADDLVQNIVGERVLERGKQCVAVGRGERGGIWRVEERG